MLFEGYSKESQKALQTYRTKDRFEANPQTQAIVSAKYMCVEFMHLKKEINLLQKIIFQFYFFKTYSPDYNLANFFIPTGH